MKTNYDGIKADTWYKVMMFGEYPGDDDNPGADVGQGHGGGDGDGGDGDGSDSGAGDSVPGDRDSVPGDHSVAVCGAGGGAGGSACTRSGSAKKMDIKHSATEDKVVLPPYLKNSWPELGKRLQDTHRARLPEEHLRHQVAFGHGEQDAMGRGGSRGSGSGS